MNNKRVLISGAGIGGLTLAYWLKRYGFVPTLIEKHPMLRSGGYKIDIRGVALEIVKQMQIYDKIVENQTEIDQAIFIDKAGNQITEMSADLSGIRQEGIDLEIMRGDLCLIIKEAIGDVEFIFDDSITQMTETINGVNVEFEKGKPRTFDLVVGADGLHSKVRRIVFGDEKQFLKEMGVYIAVFPIPNFLHLKSGEIEHHSLRKFVNVYKDRKDENAKVALAFSVSESFNARDPAEQKKMIKKVYANGKWETPRILAEMDESKDFYFDAMAQVHMPSWSKGRVTLVGDAAYAPTPMSGQGTSIAIAGAYVLAGELAESQGDYLAGFNQYEKVVRPFVEKNQALADASTRIMAEGLYSYIMHSLMDILPAKLLHYFKNQSLKNTTEAANALPFKTYKF